MAGLRIERDDTKLSSKLLDIILNGIQEELSGPPNTGISDDETDSEDITETLDFVRDPGALAEDRSVVNVAPN